VLGPGLLESAYEECLRFELASAGLIAVRQVPLPVVYRDVRVSAGSGRRGPTDCRGQGVERLLPIHDAQVLTYLKLSGLMTALLINFNVLLLKNGLRRFVA
jgi:hypothetical protein